MKTDLQIPTSIDNIVASLSTEKLPSKASSDCSIISIFQVFFHYLLPNPVSSPIFSVPSHDIVGISRVYILLLISFITTFKNSFPDKLRNQKELENQL